LKPSLTITRIAVAGLALAAVYAPALAQSAKPYVPKEYQPGKDVVWVPTAQALVDRMLDMAKVTPADYVIDLGSGDGRTVITAARRGAKAHGIEYNPDMVALSKKNAEKAGVTDRATFVKADIFQTDFSQATVLTLFLLPELNVKLRPRILAMKPGTRVVSNSFDMGDWAADEVSELVQAGCRTYCNAFLWIVPAKVEGTWKTGEGELAFKQRFQAVTGTLTFGNVAAPVKGKLNGTEIAFSAGATRYQGKVGADTIAGTRSEGGKETPWRATRVR
jgi:SAM-dependent methyltransferase